MPFNAPEYDKNVEILKASSDKMVIQAFLKEEITGTVNYATCKKKHGCIPEKIHARQDDENMLMGKALAELRKNLHDFPYSNLKLTKSQSKVVTIS